MDACRLAGYRSPIACLLEGGNSGKCLATCVRTKTRRVAMVRGEVKNGDHGGPPTTGGQRRSFRWRATLRRCQWDPRRWLRDKLSVGAGEPQEHAARPPKALRWIGVLLRRAGHRSIRAENAAIAWLGPKQRLAVTAFIKVTAGARRHRFEFGDAANRADQYGFQKNLTHQRFSQPSHRKSVGITLIRRFE